MRKNILSLFISVATLLILGGTIVWADEPLAIVRTSPSGIVFQNVSSEDLALTVSSKTGVYAQMDISAGENKSFVPNDANGLLPDGQYKYELMTIPKANMEQLKAQRGYFEITNGLIVPHKHTKMR